MKMNSQIRCREGGKGRNGCRLKDCGDFVEHLLELLRVVRLL